MAEATEQADRKQAPAHQDNLALIGRRWKLSIVLPLGLGVATYLLAAFLPKWYEGKSTVRIAKVHYGDDVLNLTGVAPRDLETSFTTGEVLREVVSDLKLAEEHGLDVAHLARSLVSVSVPKATSRIDIEARMPSPKLARDVAALVAEKGVALYVESMQAEYEAMLQKLKQEAGDAEDLLEQAEADLEKSQVTHRLDTLNARVAIHRKLGAAREERILELHTNLAVERAKIAAHEKQLKAQDPGAEVEKILAQSPPLKQGMAELEKIRADREAFRKTARIETLRAEIDVQQELKSLRETNRATLTQQQVALKAKIEAVRKSLADESPTIRLDRKLVRDSAFQQALAALSGKALQELLAMNMTESVVNAVYVSLKTDLASTQASLEETSGQLVAIDKAAVAGDKGLSDLRERLFGRERELEALTLQHELAMKRVLGAAAAVAQDSGVLTPLYLQSLKEIIAAKTRAAAVRAELDVLEQAANETRKTLLALEDGLFKAERVVRERTFRRDQAIDVAVGTLTKLRVLRNTPKWPPVSLTVTTGFPPTAPASPRKARLAAGVVVVSAMLIWGVLVYLARTRRE